MVADTPEGDRSGSGHRVRATQSRQRHDNSRFAMNNETLEKVLKCPTLPSLPAVALKVIDLTSNPAVKMEELARTIQNDQGLAAKILRTVNSSFYGLRKPCSTIHAAIVMLGLGPVKTLALGFSLVSAIAVTSSFE